MNLFSHVHIDSWSEFVFLRRWKGNNLCCTISPGQVLIALPFRLGSKDWTIIKIYIQYRSHWPACSFNRNTRDHPLYVWLLLFRATGLKSLLWALCAFLNWFITLNQLSTLNTSWGTSVTVTNSTWTSEMQSVPSNSWKTWVVRKALLYHNLSKTRLSQLSWSETNIM